VPSKEVGFSMPVKPTDENYLSRFWIVRKLGNFKFNLIQKNNIIMILVTSIVRFVLGRQKHHVDDANQQGFD
jgi:hypothetical protein